jgi:hypothetical protein
VRLVPFLVALSLCGAALGASHGEPLAQPVGCTTDATKARVRAFAINYTSGRVATVERMWAPEPRFQWFSTGSPGARLGARAYDRSTLAAYFRARVRVHERIRVLRVGAGYDEARNLVHFNGKLVRSADDLRPKILDFKGAMDCEGTRPTLIVWSM